MPFSKWLMHSLLRSEIATLVDLDPSTGIERLPRFLIGLARGNTKRAACRTRTKQQSRLSVLLLSRILCKIGKLPHVPLGRK